MTTAELENPVTRERFTIRHRGPGRFSSKSESRPT